MGGVRTPNRPVIYVEGLWDLLHCGHLDILQRILERERSYKMDDMDEDNSRDEGSSLDFSEEFRQKGAMHAAWRDGLVRTHGRRSTDPYLIVGVLDRPGCVQTVHERGLCALSLRAVDEVVLGTVGLGRAPIKAWSDFQHALGVDRVYVVVGHPDFIAEGWLGDRPDNCKIPIEVVNCSDVRTNRESLLKRFKENRAEFEMRQKLKKEPALIPRSKAELQALGA